MNLSFRYRYRKILTILMLLVFVSNFLFVPTAFATQPIDETKRDTYILPRSDEWAFGLSVFLFLMLPYLANKGLFEHIDLKKIYEKTIRKEKPDLNEEQVADLVSIFEKNHKNLFTAGKHASVIASIGLAKFGLDLGYFIAMGEDPLRAATLSSLITFTLMFYTTYYLFGEKVIMDRLLKKIDINISRANTSIPNELSEKLKKLVSLWAYMDLNATSEHVPISRVIAKPAMVSFALFLSWPASDVALLFSQTGSINLAPYNIELIKTITSFFAVAYFSQIISFNLFSKGYERASVYYEKYLSPNMARFKENLTYNMTPKGLITNCKTVFSSFKTPNNYTELPFNMHSNNIKKTILASIFMSIGSAMALSQTKDWLNKESGLLTDKEKESLQNVPDLNKILEMFIDLNGSEIGNMTGESELFDKISFLTHETLDIYKDYKQETENNYKPDLTPEEERKVLKFYKNFNPFSKVWNDALMDSIFEYFNEALYD